MTALNGSLIGMTLLLVASGTESKTLIGRLGAARFADRQAASAELEKLGREALLDLKQARADKDAEVRSRAAILVQRIENDLMVQATTIRLDFHDRPLSEVVKAVGERSGVNLSLFPANATALNTRKVTLERPEAVPFWEALDLLCRAGDIQYNAGMPLGGFGPSGPRIQILNLFQATPSARPLPACFSGPFRLSLSAIQFHRERNFTGSNAPLPFPGAAPAGANASPANEQFFASLQILAEPRLNVSLGGPVKLLEAFDDLGQSLLPGSSGELPSRHNSGYNGYETVVGVSLSTPLAMRYPAQPGQVIRRLRGTVPLVVSARKEEPLAIPLAEAKGKVYKSGEMTVSVMEIKPDGVGGQASLELALQSSPSAANSGGIAPEFLIAQMLRSTGNTQGQVEILDDRGRIMSNWYVSSQNYSPDGLRVTLQFTNSEGLAAPAQLRYYELAKTVTSAEFLFENVDMP